MGVFCYVGLAHAGCEVYSDCSGGSCSQINEHELFYCNKTSVKYEGFSETGLSRPVYALYSCTECQSGYRLVGHEVQLSPSCVVGYNNCEKIPTSSCAKGKYLKNGNCVSCDSPGTTAAAGAMDVTSCYIPAGTVLSDTPGAYKYTVDCYYK